MNWFESRVPDTKTEVLSSFSGQLNVCFFIKVIKRAVGVRELPTNHLLACSNLQFFEFYVNAIGNARVS